MMQSTPNTATVDRHVSGQTVRIYADPGTEVDAHLYSDSSIHPLAGRVSFSGHLELVSAAPYSRCDGAGGRERVRSLESRLRVGTGFRSALNVRLTASQGSAPAGPNRPLPLLLAMLEVVPSSAAPVAPSYFALDTGGTYG